MMSSQFRSKCWLKCLGSSVRKRLGKLSYFFPRKKSFLKSKKGEELALIWVKSQATADETNHANTLKRSTSWKRPFAASFYCCASFQYIVNNTKISPYCRWWWDSNHGFQSLSIFVTATDSTQKSYITLTPADVCTFLPIFTFAPILWQKYSQTLRPWAETDF